MPKYIFEKQKIIGKEKFKVLDVATGTGDITFNIIENQ